MSQTDTVYLGESRRVIRVDPSQLLKKGGNGSAYRLDDDTVLKVFHDYNPTEAQKLQDMSVLFSKAEKTKPIMYEVTRQRELGFDRLNRIIAFTMRYLNKQERPIWELTQSAHRQRLQLTPAMTARIFLAGIPVMNHIHEDLKMCIGDHNYRNTFYRLGSNQITPEDLLRAVIDQHDDGHSQWLVIDVDSFQFGRYGSEGDQLFLDPQLYNRDLTQPVFTPGNDWYSFAVMLHWAITGGHPFGGGHRQYRTLDQRMAHKVSVYDPSVIYSGDDLPLSVIGEPLTKTLRSYFDGDFRDPFPMTVLIDYIDKLEGRVRPGLGVSPEAIPVPARPARQEPVVNVSDLLQLLNIKGYVAASLVDGGMVHVLSVEQGMAVYYLLDAASGASKMRTELLPQPSGNRLSLFLGTNSAHRMAPYMVVDPPLTDWLDIYEITSSGAVKVGEVETGSYLAQDLSMFSTGKRHLIYMIHGDLFALSIEQGRMISRTVRSYRLNQTWFIADQNSDEPSLVVSYNTINDTKYVYVLGQREYSLPIESLGMNESLEEVNAYFAAGHVLVVRRTKEGGKYFVRYEIATTEGQLVYNSHKVSINDPDMLFTMLAGRIYSRAKDGSMDLIMHPSADGMKQQRVQDTAIRPFALGQSVVSANTLLYQISVEGRKAILAINQDSIYRIG